MRQPRRIAMVADNSGGDKGAGDTDEDRVAAVKHDFKCQTQPPKEHFEKLLEATCPYHSYPVKHKLKDCAMMEKFMMSGPSPKIGSLAGPCGKSAAPIPGEAEVTC
jgi:hypothetical protein